MPRLSGWLATFALWLVVALPSLVLAQSEPMPDRGEVLELRRDDPRAREGYRAFIFGSFVRGMPSIAHVLERVNADLDESERVSLEQFDRANPCQVIYHYAGVGNRHNGHCTSNPTRERVTYENFCGDAAAHRCVRWPMAGRVYYVPARSVLTPGERAEEMARRLDETSVTETVPAPAQLGGWLTELSDLMGEDQAPSYDQVRGVIGAVGRTLTRAESADAANDPSVGSPDSEPAAAALSGAPSGEADARTTPDDVESPHPTNAVSSRSTSSSTSSEAATFWTMNPRYLWLIIAILSVAVILLLLKDNLRWFKPIAPAEDDSLEHETPATLTEEQEHGLRIFYALERCWKQYHVQSVELKPDSLALFFDTAQTNRTLVEDRDKKITQVRVLEQELKDQQERHATLKNRIRELEASQEASPQAAQEAFIKPVELELQDLKDRLSDMHERLSLAERAKTNAEATLTKDRLSAFVQFNALHDMHDAYKNTAVDLLTQLHHVTLPDLRLAIEMATQIGDDSHPSFVTALERMQHVKQQFDAMMQGTHLALLQHLAPELDQAVAVSSESVVSAHVASSEPEQASEDVLKREPTMPGIGGVTQDADSSTDASLQDHPVSSSSRRRIITERFERFTPGADDDSSSDSSVSESPDESTNVIDSNTLERKRVEARTGDTLKPGPMPDADVHTRVTYVHLPPSIAPSSDRDDPDSE